jgi:hypothetical protein
MVLLFCLCTGGPAASGTSAAAGRLEFNVDAGFSESAVGVGKVGGAASGKCSAPICFLRLTMVFILCAALYMLLCAYTTGAAPLDSATLAFLIKQQQATNVALTATNVALTAMSALLQRLVPADEHEASSAATPEEYEANARRLIGGRMESYFGLRAVPGCNAHRLCGEIDDFTSGLPSVEWDYRMPVMVNGTPCPLKPPGLHIYPDRDNYCRPAPPPRARHLTPTKLPGSAEAPACDYLAIFEATTNKRWTDDLLRRLECRLRVSLDRARSLVTDACVDMGILDVVAVVGIVTYDPRPHSVTLKLGPTSPYALLRTMMAEGRFVCMPYGSGSAASCSSPK